MHTQQQFTSAPAGARRLIDINKVKAKTNKGRTKIYEGVADGTFPRPIRDGRRTLWVESEVDAWIDARIAERDAAQESVA